MSNQHSIFGERSATTDGKRLAMVHFNNYIGGLNNAEIKEENVQDVLTNFAAWLCVQTKSDGDFYAAQTMTQYLSGVKETILSQNKSWMIWHGHDTRNGWYCRLRRGLEATAGKRLIDSGERMEETSPPLSRRQVIEIIMHFLMANTRDGIVLGSMVCLNRCCVGRSGELAIQSWDCLTWNDSEGAAALEWHEIKTTDRKEVLLNNDFKSYQLCPKFMFALIMISESCKNVTVITSDGNFIFPSLAALSKPSVKINKAIKKLIRPVAMELPATADDKDTYVDGLDPATTATSIRTGAINDLVADWKNISFAHLVMRSGHDHTNLCAVFEYIWANHFLQATAGRSLGGWPHPQHRISPPTFTPITDELHVDRILVTNFIHALLCIDDNDLGVCGRLWMFSVTCAATFMMYYPDFKKDIGSSHFVVIHAEAVFTKFGLNSSTVREWSNKIRSNWDRENAHCLIQGDETAVTAALQSQLNYFAEELSKLKEQGRRIESELQTLSEQQRFVADLISDLLKHQGITSPP